ncbi:MAG: hypothetical protein DI616_15120 [Paracoccus denitrificans]|uniref:Uncharacterized protein n=1 Tax=Paracoccus denitrificans TaxID=266 RepID=A0A533I5G6_PARDE|nr:MAG: hypothetical protein DI616_15120 [Paracoccus denitrificans]
MINLDNLNANNYNAAFKLNLDYLKIADKEILDTSVLVSYDQNWRVNIDLSQHFALGEALSLMSSNSTGEVLGSIDGEEFSILLTQVGGELVEGRVAVMGTLKCEPLNTGPSSKYTTLSGIVISPPDLTGKDLVLNDNKGRTFTLKPTGKKGAKAMEIEIGLPAADTRIIEHLGRLHDFLTFLNPHFPSKALISLS